jgi:chorismate--pyruvate lyase
LYAAPSPNPAPPRWHDWRHYRTTALPPRLRPWLLDPGSLTRHLTLEADGDFRVERLFQRWQRPQLSERRRLGLRPGEWSLVREVILWVRGEPWVYARSILPASTLTGDLHRLRRLQNSSLGSLLFRQRGLQRAPFELARVDGRKLPAALACDDMLWGRRSRFELDGRPLIVGEIFLPAFQPRRAPRGR